MSVPALLMALAMVGADAPPAPPPTGGEPLPQGVPLGDYPLTAWCYGAMSEYLDIYDRVKPDLRAIDKMFGSSEPNETEPYASDIAAARDELKILAEAVEAAEKASPKAIAPEGVEAIKQGRSIWSPIEAKTRRELARAWLSWAMPDRCDSTARSLTARSALLGQALKYNIEKSPETPTEPAGALAPKADAPVPLAIPAAEPAATPPQAPNSATDPTAAPPAPQASAAPAPDSQGAQPTTIDEVLPKPDGAPAAMAPSPPAESYQPPDPNGPVPDTSPQTATPHSR